MAKRMAPKTYDGETRDKILEVSTKLFAMRGYKTVTLRDVSYEVGINFTTLYYYYKNKKDLFESTLEHCENVLKSYDKWMREKNGKAETLKEVMQNIFNEHFLAVLAPTGRLGMAITLKEQHNLKVAYEAMIDNFYKDSIETIKWSFDKLIDKGVIPQSRTRGLATLFMLCIMSANDLHLHAAKDTEVPIDCTATYDDLKRLMTAALTQGTLEVDR